MPGIEASYVSIPPIDITDKESNVLILNLLKLWGKTYYNHLQKSAQKAFNSYSSVLNSTITNSKQKTNFSSLNDSRPIWKSYYNFCLEIHATKSPAPRVKTFISQVKSYSNKLEHFSQYGHLDINHRINLADSYLKVAKAYFEQIPAEHSEIKKKSKFYKDSAEEYLKIIKAKKDLSHPDVKKLYSKLIRSHKHLLDTYSKSLQERNNTSSDNQIISITPHTSPHQNKTLSKIHIHGSEESKIIDSQGKALQRQNQHQNFTQKDLKEDLGTTIPKTTSVQSSRESYQEKPEKKLLELKNRKRRTQVSKKQLEEQESIIDPNSLDPTEDHEQGPEYHTVKNQLIDRPEEATSLHEPLISKLNQRLRSPEINVKEALKTNSGMREVWKDRDNQISKLTFLIEAERAETAGLATKIELLKAQAADEEMITKQERDTLNSELAKLEDQLESHQRATESLLFTLRLELKTLEKQKPGFTLISPPSQTVIETLKLHTNEDLGREVEKGRERIRKLEKQLEESKTQAEQNNEATKEDKKRHAEEIAQLKDRLEKEKTSYQQAISEIERRFSALEVDLNKALAKNKSHVKNLEENSNQIGKLISRVEAQRKNIEELENEVDLLRAQAKDKNLLGDQEREALTLKLSKLEDHLEAQQKAAEKSILQLRAQLEKIGKENQDLKLTFYVSQKIKDKLKSKTLQNLGSEIEKREQRIQNLERQLKDLQTQEEQNNTATTEEKGKLAVEIARLKSIIEDEATQHQAALLELQNRFFAQEHNLSKALEKNVRLQEHLNDKDNEIGQLTHQIETQRKEAEKLENEIKHLKVQSEDEKSTNDLEKEALTSQLKKLENQLAAHQSTAQNLIFRLRSKLERSEKEKQAYKLFLSVSQGVKEKLRSKTFEGLGSEIERGNQKIQSLEKQIEDLKSQGDKNKTATAEEAEKNASEILHLKTKLQDETERYEQALSELRTRLTSQEEQRQRSIKENETLKANFRTLEEKNNILFAKAHKDYNDLLNKSLQEERTKHEIELDQYLAKATREREGLTTTIAQLRNNLEQQESILKTEQDKGRDLENQLKSERDKIQSLQETKAQRYLNAKNAIATEVARTTKSLQEQLKQQNKVIASQNNSLKQSTDEFEQLKSQTASLEKEKTALENKVLHLQANNDSLNRDLAASQAKLIEFEKLNKEQIQEIKSFTEQLNDSKKDYDTLSLNLIKLEKENEADQTLQDQNFNAQIQKAYDDLKKATQNLDHYEKVIQKYKHISAADDAKINQLENSLTKNQKALTELLLEMKNAEESHQQESSSLKAKLQLLKSNMKTFETQIDSQTSQLEEAYAEKENLKKLLKQAQTQLDEFMTEKARNISRIEKQVESLEEKNKALEAENKELKERLNLANHRGREYVENEIAIRENAIHEHDLKIHQLKQEKDLFQGNLDKLDQILESKDTTQILSYFSPEIIPELHKKRDKASKIPIDQNNLDQDLNNFISHHRRIVKQKHTELNLHDDLTLKQPINEQAALRSMNRAQNDRDNQIETAKNTFDLLNNNTLHLIDFVESLLKLPDNHQKVENHVNQTEAKINKLAEENKLQSHLKDDPEISRLLEKLQGLRARNKIGEKFLGEYSSNSCSNDRLIHQTKTNVVQLLSIDINNIYEAIAKRLDQLHIESEISKFLKDILEDYVYDNQRSVHTLTRIQPNIPINYSQIVRDILEASEKSTFTEEGVTSEKSKVHFNHNGREFTFEFQFMHNPDPPKHEKYLIPLRLNQGELKLGSEATFKEVYHALNMSDFHREVYFHVNNEGSLGINYIDDKLKSRDERGGNINKRVAFHKTKSEIIAEQHAMRIANQLLHRERRSHQNAEHYLEPYYGIDLNQVFERRKNKDSRDEFDQQNNWIKLRDDCARAIITQMDTLHKNNFIHRDIKPQNIMFKPQTNTTNSPVCNLIDFGSSIFYTNGKIESAGYNFTPGFVGWKYDLKANEGDSNYETFRHLEKTINDDNKILFSNKDSAAAPSIPTENPEEFSNWMLKKLGRDESGSDNRAAYQYLGVHNDYFQMAIVLLNLYYGNDDELKGEVDKIMNVLKNLDLLRLYDRSGTMPEDGGPGGIIRNFLNSAKVKNSNNPAVTLMKTMVYAFFPVSYVNNTLDPKGHFFMNINDCSNAIKTYLNQR